MKKILGKWYNLNTDPTEVEVEWNKTNDSVIQNELKKGSIRVIKVDKDDNTVRIPNVTFEVLDKNNNVLEKITTNENGEAKTKEYAIRDYEELKIHEIETDKYYVLNDEVQTVKLEANQIKNITFEVVGDNAYGYLKSEKGVHRLVRISPFNAQGKRQTSFVSLDVMPDIEEDLDVDINEDDLRIDTYRSSGAGGQHINKTSSAIRITHIPTGTVVQCQNERSQFQNKDKAMQMLKAKLYLLKKEANAEKLSDIRGEVKEIGWGNQIRSYVMQPYTMVKDHRTGFETGNVDAVMDGALDGFINAYLKWKSTGGKPVVDADME